MYSCIDADQHTLQNILVTFHSHCQWYRMHAHSEAAIATCAT